MKIYDEPYQRCGKKVCLEPAQAKRAIQNKIEIYNWMQNMNAVVCYYEVREGTDVCVSGASPSH